MSTGSQEYVPRDGGVEGVLIEKPALAQGALEVSGTDKMCIRDRLYPGVQE